MGRPKTFTRQAVLEKALPIFWRHGFADASLHELEQATGVNKSGLYAEFKGKEDLFVQSLRYYLGSLEKEGLLTAEPLGWNNVERFLKLGPRNLEGQKGCFAVSSMREFPILPPDAVDIITRSRNKLKQLIAKNIEAEHPKMDAGFPGGIGPDFLYRAQYGTQPEFEPPLHRPQNRGSDEHSPNAVNAFLQESTSA